MSLVSQLANMKFITVPETSTSITTVAFATVLITWMSTKFLNWAWLRPRKLEKLFREQGFSGNPYRFLHGDIHEALTLIKQAETKIINPPHDYMLRVLPFESHILQKYGKLSNPVSVLQIRFNVLDLIA